MEDYESFEKMPIWGFFARPSSLKRGKMKRKLLAGLAVGVMMFGVSVVGATPIITNGLVAAYEFNGNADDSSGNGNNGTVNGATLTTDRNGNADSAYYFNNGAYINVANTDPLKLGNELTISTWINFSGGNQNPRIISFGADNYYGYEILTIGTGNQRMIAAGIYSGSIASTNTLSSDSWHQVVLTAGSGVLSLYIDGILDHTTSFSPVTPNYSVPFDIGRKSIYAYDYFGGKLDDIFIYNRTLSSDEITTLYTGGAPVPPPVTTKVPVMNGLWLIPSVLTGLYLLRRRKKPSA